MSGGQRAEIVAGARGECAVAGERQAGARDQFDHPGPVTVEHAGPRIDHRYPARRRLHQPAGGDRSLTHVEIAVGHRNPAGFDFGLGGPGYPVPDPLDPLHHRVEDGGVVVPVLPGREGRIPVERGEMHEGSQSGVSAASKARAASRLRR